MAVREILLLGNPMLRARGAQVKRFHGSGVGRLVDDLRDTLQDFRSRSGFGRGIAAPQIGSSLRAILVDVDGPVPLINPVITRRSRKMITLWDDCFSFPEILVKVRRNLAIQVRYQDLDGKHHTMSAEGSLSELLQHEIDHLDGILAIERAIDLRHIIYRSEYQKQVIQADGAHIAL